MHMFLSLILSAWTALSPQQDEEQKAMEQLRKAEAQAAKGNYKVAYNRYLNIAHHHAETAAGKIAEQRSQPNALLGWKDMLRTGPSSNRVDVVLMGDGYLLKKQDSFDRMVEIVPKIFERNPVLGEYHAYHNIMRANIRSADDKVGGFGRDEDTALKGRASGASGGQVTVDRNRVRNYLGQLPENDGFALVFVKAGAHGTGGGGIAAVGGRPDVHIVLHEWAHAFASLGDEYEQDVGSAGAVSARANVADTDDPSKVPWRHFLEAKVPRVGIFRGAAGRTRGAWKPTVKGCVMDSSDDFCVVCREAMVLRIYHFVDPIDACLPDHQSLGEKSEPLDGAAPVSFEVTVMEPDSHDLQVRWWVLGEHDAPQSPEPDAGGRDRRDRGLLPEILAIPDAETDAKKGGVHRFVVEPDKYPSGLYRVVCRVIDDTEVRGSRFPWVLEDRFGVLESERSWWLLVP